MRLSDFYDRGDRYGDMLEDGHALLQMGRLTALRTGSEAREYADAIFNGEPMANVWDATAKRRPTDRRGGVEVDRLEQLRWAVEEKCLKCGEAVSGSYGVGAGAWVLCSEHAASEHGSDRLRRGLATFVLELRDARAPTPPAGAMPTWSAEEIGAYKLLVAQTSAALAAAEPDEHGVQRLK